jgi:hypothetical protein
VPHHLRRWSTVSAAAPRSGPAKGARVCSVLPRHFPRTAGLAAMAAAMAVAVVAGAGAPAMAAAQAAAAQAAVAASAAPAARLPGASFRPVLLINGERVMFRPGPHGAPAAAVQAATGTDTFLLIMYLCQQVDDVPAVAMPFLGRGLDPSLFEVSALQRLEKNGRLPVQVTYQGRHAPSLPGVTITRTAPGAADGYLTARSARKFGAALARQYRADRASGGYGTDGLFAGGVSIALAGAAPPPVRPAFVQHTLTVKGRDLAGKPDTGDEVLVFNADNCARFSDPVESVSIFRDGVTKFSVPAGHYWAIGCFIRLSGRGFTTRIVILPQFTVARNSTVHVAERSATSKITIATPRPAVSQLTSFTVARGGQAGSAININWAGNGGQFWVSPTSRKPTVGSLQTFTSAVLTSPGGAGVPYAYNLDLAGPAGLIPVQHFVVRPASLATISEHYYQDMPSAGAWTTIGTTATQFDDTALFLFDPLKLPGRQIQYMNGNPAVLWYSEYWEFQTTSNFFAGQIDPMRSLHAGQHLTEDWNRYPLHPAPDVSLAGSGALATQLSAGRIGNLLTLDVTPFSDNQRGHLGTGFFTGLFDGSDARMSGHYEIDQNGAQVAAGNALSGIPPVRLSRHPSVIRFLLTAARIGKRYVLSPSSRTVWTWRSRRDASATLPPAWFCGEQSFATTQQCAVQPMMTLRYQVGRLAMDGSAPAGRQAIGISVGHIQLATAAHVTGAQVQVSFNDGRTWRSASVAAAGGGRFRAVFTAPAGALVTMRVTATDTAGGSIRETILRAYKIAS